MELLKAEHITKKYSGRTIIEDINIQLEEGELVSLLGVSGAGKTTLFHVLSGLVAPEEGRVLLSGEDITAKPGRISYMMQKDLLLPHKKIIDNVSLPLVLNGVKKQEARKKAEPLFGEFGLEGTQYQYPSQLSGGMRQRAALLRTYLSSNGVALLDEPFSALDTITKSNIHRWYLDVMEKIHLSTLFITHDIDEAILLSDRIYILNGKPGRITEEIVIEEQKPRPADFNLTDTFFHYKKEIISKLAL
ncbi:MAG TPA: ABC transporter ATP-binding protein [Candidatus Anaerobutyricum avicola]|nr:ABC transporter ATP-binding protein [Candidatus Anaerobutyricum avicola]